jgi:hypothetical protein
MIRIEVFANNSVEENLFEAFQKEGVVKLYTKYSNVSGVGNSGPRMGDAIWPEVNFSLVIWCELKEARGIARAVAEVKKHFPNEGINIFGLPDPNAQVPALPAYAPPAYAAVGAADVVPAGPAVGTTQEPPRPVRPPDFGGENF